MVALIAAQPALRLEAVRVREHLGVPRRCEVAQRDQSLRGGHGDRLARGYAKRLQKYHWGAFIIPVCHRYQTTALPEK